MYALSTMVHLNSVADAKAQLLKTPLRSLNHPDDIRRSPDFSQVKISLIEKAAHVSCIETYFVDSSGLGSPSEPALTFNAFKLIITRLLTVANIHNERLFCALTGVGQFQVYVSIFTDGKVLHYANIN